MDLNCKLISFTGEEGMYKCLPDKLQCHPKYKLERIDTASEHVIAKACSNDNRCYGYDYSKELGFGHTCSQAEYPGNSTQLLGYKLCEKKGMSLS